MKKDAKVRLIAELTKIYKLSAILGWEVVDETEEKLLDSFYIEKSKF